MIEEILLFFALSAKDCLGRTRRLKIKRQLIILFPRNTMKTRIELLWMV